MAALLISIYSIYAQNAPAGLVVHPSNFDLIGATATPTTQIVTLDNKTDQPQTIKVDVRNFTPNGEEGGVNLTNEDTNFSLAKWIKVSPVTTSIAAHSSSDFTFTITPPKNAEAGGHFGSIVFATVPNPNTKGNVGAALSQEVASLILFKIPGNVEERAVIESFATDKKFYEFGPVTFFDRVKNLGGVHILPVGQIIISGTFGDKYIVNIDPRNVLPNSIRKIPSTLSNTFLLGKYSARIVATYGTKNEQLDNSTEFYVFPVRYGVGVGLILIILFLLRKRLKKALKALAIGK